MATACTSKKARKRLTNNKKTINPNDMRAICNMINPEIGK
jgi:hypothetical protein